MARNHAMDRDPARLSTALAKWARSVQDANSPYANVLPAILCMHRSS